MIELYTKLLKICPEGHRFSEHEIQAWHSMLRSTGCKNITPFPSKGSHVSTILFIYFYFLYLFLLDNYLINIILSLNIGLELKMNPTIKKHSDIYMKMVF